MNSWFKLNRQYDSLEEPTRFFTAMLVMVLPYAIISYFARYHDGAIFGLLFWLMPLAFGRYWYLYRG